jgi:hypothetical protein
MVPDIDRATWDPRTLEDLIDAVELYGLYVASLTGNINDGRGYFRRAGPGESAAQESRNTFLAVSPPPCRCRRLGRPARLR